MVFDVAKLVAILSQVITLEAGDIISTESRPVSVSPRSRRFT
jgi:2-keto-4-pentenoate hydratase/2-oxohepta-3-ene-1,7-dioic acid hydratase in catechol pathway